MSTRECTRCGETCNGCDNDDDPHYCPSCKEARDMEKLKGIQAVLDGAQAETARFNHDYVGTEHLLLSLLTHSTSGVFERLKVSRSMVRGHIERIVQGGPSMTSRPEKLPLTPRSKRAIEFAEAEARRDGHLRGATERDARMTPDDLLVGLILEEEGVAATVLRELGVTVEKAREAIKGLIDFGAPCEHVQEFLAAIRGIYAKQRHFVTLDEPINAHCHVCSGVHKIPEDLMKRPVKSAETPKAEKSKPIVTIRRHVTQTINVRSEDGRESVPLHAPISVWEIAAEDGNGVWEETYAAKEEKDAFVRGFRAASSFHGDMDPKIVDHG